MNGGRTGHPLKPSINVAFLFIEPIMYSMTAETDAGIRLFEGESLLKTLKPHLLAFYDMYLIWVWIILLSAAFILWGQEISRPLTNPVSYATDYVGMFANKATSGPLGKIPYYSDAMNEVSSMASSASSATDSNAPVWSWLIILLLSSLLISAFRIEWKWVALMIGVGVGSFLATGYFGLPAQASYQIAIFLSLIGACFVELYRRSHTFYITDRRIVTEARFAGMRRNELSFDKINNVILEQSLIGSLFGFGTVIPVTASGLGMGGDFSAVTVGGQGQVPSGPAVSASVTGGRMIQSPRARSMYCLFGVTNPEEIQALVSKQVQSYVEAPYLKRMTEQLDEIKRKND